MSDRAPDDAAAHNRDLHHAIVLTAAEFALPFARITGFDGHLDNPRVLQVFLESGLEPKQ
jgi:hypothetical protein